MKIVTNNLLLRPVELNDIDRFSDIYADPDVMRYIYDGAIFSKETTQNKIDDYIQHWKNYGFGVWVLIENKSSALAGYCMLRHFKDTHPSLENQIELGYIIDKPFWVNGYATEAAFACIQVGFEKYHFSRILSTILPENTNSQNVVRKAGMVYQYDLDVKGMIHRIYEITADEYHKMQALNK